MRPRDGKQVVPEDVGSAEKRRPSMMGINRQSPGGFGGILRSCVCLLDFVGEREAGAGSPTTSPRCRRAFVRWHVGGGSALLENGCGEVAAAEPSAGRQ